MGVLSLLCLALSVVAALGLQRVRGDPVWQGRENVPQSQGNQDPHRYVQLPQSILNNLLSDPRYSEELRQIIAANVAPEVVPIRPVPVQPTQAPVYQYKPQPEVQNELAQQFQEASQPEPSLEVVRQPSPPQPQPLQYQAQYRPQTQAARNRQRPRQQTRQQTRQRPRHPSPSLRPAVYPKGNELLIDAQVGHILRNVPGGARLVATNPTIPALIERLPDNATLIRPNIVDTFSCSDKAYGYYADVDNDCQLYHVCVPYQQLYPDNFTSPVTYTFSFICPAYTIFSQDVMVCVWASDAVPCEIAPSLYPYNQNFFRRVEDEEGGERWAHVNEALEEGGEVAPEGDDDVDMPVTDPTPPEAGARYY